MPKPSRVLDCPDWPAVMTVADAALYLRRESRLLGLIARGYLSPWHHGHRDTDFLKSEIDTALQVARINRDLLEIPDEVRTVTAALALREQLEKAA